MVLLERTANPVRLSFVTAMLTAEGVDFHYAWGTPTYFYSSRPPLHDIFVAEADAPRARALLRALDAAPLETGDETP